MKNYTVPEDRQKIPRRSLNRSRILLVSVIAVTSLLPLVFVQLGTGSIETDTYFFLAKIGAFTGGMLLLWQFFLGFRGAVSRIITDLTWVVDLHKKLGQYGTLVIPLHPVFIGLFYYRSYQLNVYDLDLGTRFSQLVLLGIILLSIIAFIVISSAFFRQKTGFYTWFYTHLSAYIVPPVLFIHSFLLGSTIQETAYRYIWWGLTGLMTVFYLYRILHKLGAFAQRYRTAGTRFVAEQTTELTLEPHDGGLTPAPGQFIYIRGSIKRNAHPYTVSGFEEKSGKLSITAKEEGPQSARFQETEEGKNFILDGPYGVFTRVAYASGLPLVMIAGGIGITPFRRLWRKIEKEKDREAWLFYGNEFYRNIVYKDELDALEYVKVIHILNQEPDFPGEKGFVTTDILKRHLERDLSEYQFLICGPPVMIIKLEEALREAGIPDERIQHELFAT
ncbi:MAG: hypothetical protein ACLFST_05280 [Spirochaetia bacterium]